MPTEQDVVVKIEDEKEYEAGLFGGGLDINALEEELAQDGLTLTKLDGNFPFRDRDGLSRRVSTASVIQAQTTRNPGEANAPPFSVHDYPCNAAQSDDGVLLYCTATACVRNLFCNMGNSLLRSCRVELDTSIPLSQGALVVSQSVKCRFGFSRHRAGSRKKPIMYMENGLRFKQSCELPPPSSSLCCFRFCDLKHPCRVLASRAKHWINFTGLGCSH